MLPTCVTCGKPATTVFPRRTGDIPFCEAGLTDCFQKWFAPIMWDVLSVPHKKKDSERELSSLRAKGTTP